MDKKQEASPSPVDTNARLSVEDTFSFACGPHVPCFTECCQKLDLLLTPYDSLRLRRRLGLSSEEFLDRHTVVRLRTAHGFPDIMLEMDQGNDRKCPFVTPQGCSVYEDRPAACRIYPLGRASTSHPMDGSRREFYFTVREDHCRGFEQPKTWKVKEWLQDQGLEPYNRMNDLLMELYVTKSRTKGIELGQQHMQMFVMSCYNTEKFRDFIFKSAFLTKFAVQPDTVESLRTDDVALLTFAFQWLRFAFFREPVLALRQ